VRLLHAYAHSSKVTNVWILLTAVCVFVCVCVCVCVCCVHCDSSIQLPTRSFGNFSTKVANSFNKKAY
jgi:hypothetical protein